VFFGAQHPCTVTPDALSSAWTRRVLDNPACAQQLSGVWSLIVFDKAGDTLHAFSDRLGVQGLHFGRSRTGAWHLSTHLPWLLLNLEHDGSVDDDSFASHLAFGYAVDPHRDVYRGVRSVRPAHCVRLTRDEAMQTRYWSPPQASGADACDPDTLVDALRGAIFATTDRSRVFLGLTAGKDSLCLASAIPDGRYPETGTLGANGCADRRQGSAIARAMRWPHVAASLCTGADFGAWADYVAFESAGLATVSYVDMAAFAVRAVPPGCAFVMGEGGECVRDFFASPSQPAMQTLVDDYMTPPDYLFTTLVPRLTQRLAGYPVALVDSLYASSGGGDVDQFLSTFYRMQRMPGNFSLRHAVLSSLRPKVSPFLDSRFIDTTYGLSTSTHAQSRVHRRVIAHGRPALLPYFETPIKADIATQNWMQRFPRIANEFRRRLAEALTCCDDVLHPEGVLALCDATAAQPSRAIYHLFRLFSFARCRLQLRQSASARLATLESRLVTMTSAASAAMERA
jgi:hypothetical protein